MTAPDPRLSFSQTIPYLQTAWDSTSLGALKTCPQFYKYSIIDGYVPRAESVHLTFGILVHSAREVYDHAKVRGASHEEAVLRSVEFALKATWDQTKGRPWISDDKYKNRFTLIRTLVWYFDEHEDDFCKTVVLANGRPAVELSFHFNTHYQAPSGEPYLLAGHMDRLVTMDGAQYISDIKTTKSQLSQDYFDGYSPDNQFSLYSLASKVMYGTPVAGIIVDGIQVAVTFSRSTRGFVPRPDPVLAEWYEDLGDWLAQAEGFAKRGRWPQNDKSCKNFGGCQYRGICSKSPSVRGEWLEAGYHHRVWDPLKVRGDI